MLIHIVFPLDALHFTTKRLHSFTEIYGEGKVFMLFRKLIVVDDDGDFNVFVLIDIYCHFTLFEYIFEDFTQIENY